MVSNSPGYSYFRFGDVGGDGYAAQEIGWDHGDFVEHKNNRPYMILWKSGKKVDQRLMVVLDKFYQEIYVKRQDFFKKIFPDRMQDDFEDVFRKVDAMLSKNREVKNKTLLRSFSFGSPRRLQRFKVKIPVVCIRNSGSRDGTSASRPSSVSDGK